MESHDAASEHAGVAFEQASLVGMDAIVMPAEKLMKARQPPRTQPAVPRQDRCLYVAWERVWSLEAGARPKSTPASIPRELKYLEALCSQRTGRCMFSACGDRRRGRCRAATRRKGQAGLLRSRRGATRSARRGRSFDDSDPHSARATRARRTWAPRSWPGLSVWVAAKACGIADRAVRGSTFSDGSATPSGGWANKISARAASGTQCKDWPFLHVRPDLARSLTGRNTRSLAWNAS